MAHLLLQGLPLGPPGWEIEAVLFDKDGTMSHSEPMLEALAQERIRTCLRLTEAHLGEAPQRGHELQELLSRAYGIRQGRIDPAGITAVASRDHNLIATATALTQMGLGWPDALAISEQVFALTDGLHGEGAGQRPQPTAGLASLLASLRHAGIGCAVISNDHEAGIRAFLAAHGFQDRFQGLWSADHRPAKPNPGAVHALCRELGVEPSRCALVGDADSDLRMAAGAGVPVVLGYRGGWRELPPLREDVPHLHHWDELQVAAGPTPGDASGMGTELGRSRGPA
ncbi:MAG: HAD family hydrolase [Synechococcaceae cyanobacterium]|jgi:phosphoglycolate phosphatase